MCKPEGALQLKKMSSYTSNSKAQNTEVQVFSSVSGNSENLSESAKITGMNPVE